MKKTLVLLGLLFLTGCSVNYELEINNSNIREDISGDIYKSEFDPIDDIYGDHSIYYLIYDEQSPFKDSTELYNKNITEEDDGRIIFDASYNYNNNYGKSRIINDCYENHLFEETENTYVIKLEGNFYCQYAPVINVTFKTDNYVLDNNAKKVDGNIYTWELSNGNTDINIIISKRVKKNEIITNDNNINYFRIVGFGILFLLIIVLFFVYNKHKNSDK